MSDQLERKIEEALASATVSSDEEENHDIERVSDSIEVDNTFQTVHKKDTLPEEDVVNDRKQQQQQEKENNVVSSPPPQGTKTTVPRIQVNGATPKGFHQGRKAGPPHVASNFVNGSTEKGTDVTKTRTPSGVRQQTSLFRETASSAARKTPKHGQIQNSQTRRNSSASEESASRHSRRHTPRAAEANRSSRPSSRNSADRPQSASRQRLPHKNSSSSSSNSRLSSPVSYKRRTTQKSNLNGPNNHSFASSFSVESEAAKDCIHLTPSENKVEREFRPSSRKTLKRTSSEPPKRRATTPSRGPMLRTSSRSQLREKKCSFRSSSTKPVEKDPQEVGPGWDSTFSKDLIQRDVKKDDLLYKGPKSHRLSSAKASEVSERLYSRAQAIKQRLSEKSSQLQQHYSFSPQLNKTSAKRSTTNTGNRFEHLYSHAESMRKKHEADVERSVRSSCTFKPKTNQDKRKRSKSVDEGANGQSQNRTRGGYFDKLYSCASEYEARRQKRRMSTQSTFTFRPELSSRSLRMASRARSQSPHRDLYNTNSLKEKWVKWEEEKRKLEEEGCTFKPETQPKSGSLVKGYANKKVYDRLYGHSNERLDRLAQYNRQYRDEEMKSATFSPNINNSSRRIVAKARGESPATIDSQRDSPSISSTGKSSVKKRESVGDRLYNQAKLLEFRLEKKREQLHAGYTVKSHVGKNKKSVASRSQSAEPGKRSSSNVFDKLHSTRRLPAYGVPSYKEKEEEELKKCTFKPNANRKSARPRSVPPPRERVSMNKPVWERLHDQATVAERSRAVRSILKEQSELQECTFVPDTQSPSRNLFGDATSRSARSRSRNMATIDSARSNGARSRNTIVVENEKSQSRNISCRPQTHSGALKSPKTHGTVRKPQTQHDQTTAQTVSHSSNRLAHVQQNKDGRELSQNIPESRNSEVKDVITSNEKQELDMDGTINAIPLAATTEQRQNNEKLALAHDSAKLASSKLNDNAASNDQTEIEMGTTANVKPSPPNKNEKPRGVRISKDDSVQEVRQMYGEKDQKKRFQELRQVYEKSPPQGNETQDPSVQPIKEDAEANHNIDVVETTQRDAPKQEGDEANEVHVEENDTNRNVNQSLDGAESVSDGEFCMEVGYEVQSGW